MGDERTKFRNNKNSGKRQKTAVTVNNPAVVIRS